MAHCSDPGGETSHFAEKGYAQLPCAHRVSLNVEVKFHPYEGERPDGFPGSAGELSCRSIRFVAYRVDCRLCRMLSVGIPCRVYFFRSSGDAII
jgi:hypothetical protein